MSNVIYDCGSFVNINVSLQLTDRCKEGVSQTRQSGKSFHMQGHYKGGAVVPLLQEDKRSRGDLAAD